MIIAYLPIRFLCTIAILKSGLITASLLRRGPNSLWRRTYICVLTNISLKLQSFQSWKTSCTCFNEKFLDCVIFNRDCFLTVRPLWEIYHFQFLLDYISKKNLSYLETKEIKKLVLCMIVNIELIFILKIISRNKQD